MAAVAAQVVAAPVALVLLVEVAHMAREIVEQLPLAAVAEQDHLV
jgi:hypothetical protein